MNADNPDHYEYDPDKAMRGTLCAGQDKIKWREMTPEEIAEFDKQQEESKKKWRIGGFRWINIPNKPSNKPSLFTRLRRKLRKHADNEKQLLIEIRELELALDKECAKSANLDRRLKSVVRGDVKWNAVRDIVRIQVDVDCRTADTASFDLYSEAMRQLTERLKEELRIRG